jgi:hypothetical protein
LHAGVVRVEPFENRFAFVVVNTRLRAVGARLVPLAVDTHLFDHHQADAIAALGAMATRPTPNYGGNVIPLHG